MIVIDPFDSAGDGGCGPGPVARPPRRQAGDGGDLHPLPRRPLRRGGGVVCRDVGVQVIAPRTFHGARGKARTSTRASS